MNENTPPELTIGFWDAQQRTVAGLAREVAHEYTSKERLRDIAKICIMQLMALFEAAKASEQQDQQPESKILTPDTRLVGPDGV
jgi:hypothetical protein